MPAPVADVAEGMIMDLKRREQRVIQVCKVTLVRSRQGGAVDQEIILMRLQHQLSLLISASLQKITHSVRVGVLVHITIATSQDVGRDVVHYIVGITRHNAKSCSR